MNNALNPLSALGTNGIIEYEGYKTRRVDVPRLTDSERYKRILQIAYGCSTTYKRLIKERYGLEVMRELGRIVQRTNSTRCAKKLIEYYHLRPTVEDALKLMYMYSCEVWGYGDSQYVSALLVSSKKGVVVNHKCRIWEKREEFGDPERPDCSPETEHEYQHMVHLLAPHLKVYMGKTFPHGDNSCDIWVEEI